MDLRNLPHLVGERASTLVAASFHDGWSAERAAARLSDLSEPAAEVIRPGERAAGGKIEPDGEGIWRTLVRSHVLLGAVGICSGVAFAGLLWLAGWPPALAMPGQSALAFATTGGFVGLLGAILVTVRPDHDWVIEQLRGEQQRGRWTVVAHARTERDAVCAIVALRAAGGRPLRSL